MTNRRTATLLLSLLIGAIAALFAYMYVNSAQDRAFDGATLAPALVATGPIVKGSPGDQALSVVKGEDVPVRFRPEGAILDRNLLRGKVAVNDIAAGQVLVAGMFVDPIVAQETAAKRVPVGQVAVSIEVSDVTGVAGLVTPGDKVNIMTRAATGEWRTLFVNVDVLYVGAVPAPAAGSTAAVAPIASNLMTFAVPPLAAEKIVFASRSPEGVYLSLVPPGNKAAPVAPVNEGNLFTGGVTPYEG